MQAAVVNDARPTSTRAIPRPARRWQRDWPMRGGVCGKRVTLHGIENCSQRGLGVGSPEPRAPTRET